jgi:hypothetical protein
MQQPALSFQRIDTDDYRAQLAQIAAAATKAAASLPPAPPKRTVGRPKRALSLDANAILKQAASTAAAAAAVAEKDEQPHKKQRGKYTDWFSSPYIHDILAGYERSGYRAVAAVKQLKAQAPDNRYERLSHSSLIGWFDENNNLLPRFQAHLDSGLENVRQNGPIAAIEEVPGVEKEIKQTLLPNGARL